MRLYIVEHEHLAHGKPHWREIRAETMPSTAYWYAQTDSEGGGRTRVRVFEGEWREVQCEFENGTRISPTQER